MRKLFLLIPALVLSLVINAAVININTETADALRKALNNAADGDIIEMEGGTYVESNGNYIAFDGKHVTVRASEGAEVLIQPQVPITISNGGCAHFENVKIDASRLTELADWYEHVIYPTDANENNSMILEGCEIYGFSLNNSLLFCGSSNRLASVTITNCYFHNIKKSCLFIQSTEGTAVEIANSTFANISTNTESYSAGVIDSRATSGSFLVDHCTFYNVQVINTDYAAIGHNKSTLSGSVVSNCIFVMPTAVDGVRAIRNVAQANNCLTFNYTKDSGKGIHGDVQQNNCIFADPLFTDAANGDYSFAGNWVTMELSPARGAATDGSDLGDPRWYSAEVLPSVDFASPYVLDGLHAKLNGNIALDEDNFLKQNNNSDPTQHGTATWKIHATKSCYVSVTPDIKGGNGHHYQIAIYDEDNNLICDPLAENDSWDSDITPNFGTILIPAAGDYKVVLSNLMNNSGATLRKITLAYIGGDVQAMPGTTKINDAWFSANGTRADGKISFPGSTIQEGWVKWNVAFANTGNYNVTLNVNSNNCKNYTVALVDANDADVVTPLTLNDCSTKGTPVALAMGAMEVPAGNYILKVTNATQNSDAELISVQFAYTGGGIIDIPGSIALNEAILSERAFIDGDGLHFVDAEHLWLMSEGYAKWNIQVATDGMYKFTANCNTYGESWSNLTIQILQGGEEKYTYTPEYTYSGEKEIKSPEWFLEAGNYELKLSNPRNHSNGYLVSLSAAVVEGFLVVDEQATDMTYIIALNGQSRKPLLKRSFKGGMYNTICFPFNNVTDAELVNLFGEGYELLELSSATLNGTELNLIFANVNLSEDTYGRPYLIKPTHDVTNPLFNSHTIYKSVSHLVKECDAVDFIGNFIAGEVPAGENNLFLGPNDLLYFSQDATPIKGMRAYFHVKGAAAAAKRARIIMKENGATAIDLVNDEHKAIKRIENGQVVILRDGIRYNVMGIKLQ